MKKRCATCVHWAAESIVYPNDGINDSWGHCAFVKNIHSLAFPYYGDDWAMLYTSPEFGCVQWASRENNGAEDVT